MKFTQVSAQTDFTMHLTRHPQNILQALHSLSKHGNIVHVSIHIS